MGLKRAFKKVKKFTKRAVGGMVDPLNITGHGGLHVLGNRGGPGMLGLNPQDPSNPQSALANQIRTLYPEPPGGPAPQQAPQWPFQGTMEPPPPLPQANPMQQYRWNQLPQKQPYNPIPQLPKMKLPGAMGGGL